MYWEGKRTNQFFGGVLDLERGSHVGFSAPPLDPERVIYILSWLELAPNEGQVCRKKDIFLWGLGLERGKGRFRSERLGTIPLVLTGRFREINPKLTAVQTPCTQKSCLLSYPTCVVHTEVFLTEKALLEYPLAVLN